MANEKLKVSWDELNSPAVEERLKQQQALADTRKHFESAPAPQQLLRNRRASIWYNTVLYMSLFGLLGGLFGWGLGNILHFRPNLKVEGDDYINDRAMIDFELKKGLTTPQRADARINRLNRNAKDNPYYQIEFDAKLSPERRLEKRAELEKNDAMRDFISDLLFYGVCGLMIAMFLGAADSIMAKNYHAAVINGAVSATLGLLGGLAISLFVDKFYRLLAGQNAVKHVIDLRSVAALSVKWGVLGLFLSLGPGLVMRNPKRLFIGLIGGLVGGLIGGALFGPVSEFTGSEHISRLIGIVTIGVVAGLGTGLIESVAKSGWLRVTAGLIAGKQFVLYRNPTYLGSAPQCQIYLFKDPQVGRRHAAVHVLPDGFEIEDLPLGGATVVNGQPISRQRLKNGDRLQIGSTGFIFQEKPRHKK